MGAFNRGQSRYEMRRKEAARTLGGQVESLTFVQRAKPAAAFEEQDRFSISWQNELFSDELGVLLTSAQNSLLYAGVTKRTVPRFQIGSRSGREFQQQVASSGNQGQITLVYNPSLRLHREFTNPPLNSKYHITSIQAPPYMNCVSGVYEHISTDPVALAPEDQPMMAVNFLDNFGAEYVPGYFYQLKEYTDSVITVEGLEDQPNVLYARTSTSWQTLGGLIDVTITLGSNFSFRSNVRVNLRAGGLFYGFLVIHFPGEDGGIVTQDLRDTVYSRENILWPRIKQKMLDQTLTQVYVGVYFTPTRGLWNQSEYIVQ